jgi:hypothetical protein
MGDDGGWSSVLEFRIGDDADRLAGRLRSNLRYFSARVIERIFVGRRRRDALMWTYACM